MVLGKRLAEGCTLIELKLNCKDLALQISTLKTKVMAFHDADPIRAKIVVGGTVLEQSVILNIRAVMCLTLKRMTL